MTTNLNKTQVELLDEFILDAQREVDDTNGNLKTAMARLQNDLGRAAQRLDEDPDAMLNTLGIVQGRALNVDLLVALRQERIDQVNRLVMVRATLVKAGERHDLVPEDENDSHVNPAIYDPEADDASILAGERERAATQQAERKGDHVNCRPPTTVKDRDGLVARVVDRVDPEDKFLYRHEGYNHYLTPNGEFVAMSVENL